jgi:hypothetical protein
MATSPVPENASRPGSTSRGDAGKFIEYGQFIDSTLRKTRQQVRNVDVAGVLMVLAAGTLTFFLLTAVLDHWVVTGGLGTVSRWAALLIFIAGSAAYSWRCLLPLLLRRINPVYAAHSIERAKPGLKNSLVNFLLFRAHPEGLTQNVFEAIEEQAATNLAKVPVEATVDRSKLIKIGYVFLTVLMVAALYKVISPKDPFKTVGRVVLPWANLDPPTRVRIVDVQPENKTVFRGQQVPISAEVQGLGGGQPVTLFYSTADGQLAGRAVPMHLPAGGYVYQCELPEGKAGIQQDLTYHIAAGDAVTHTFSLVVQAAPTIVVESIDYRYPDYTGIGTRTVDHEPDIKGIEGTQVTVRAMANQPIKKATLDLNCDGTDDQRMTFKDREAWVTFTLALKDDRQTAEHASYQLKFVNLDGQENVQPIRHQIEVTPDVAPEIQFLAPAKDNVEVPVNAALACELSANDPDYALGRVALAGSVEGRTLFEKKLLDETWRGQFNKKLSLTPKQLGLKTGDVLEYWAWAEDNRSPTANRTETPHRRMKITSPDKRQPNQDQLAAGDNADPQNRDEKRNAQPSDEQPPADDEQNQDPNRAQPNQEKQNGDEQQGGKQQGKEAEGQQGEGQKQGGKDQSGEGQKGGAQQGDKQGGEPQAGGGQSGQPDSARDEQGKGGAQKGGTPQQGGKEPADEPVAKDGSQDGAAFEKILDREREKDPNKLKPNDDKSAGNNSPGEDKKQIQGDQSGGSKPQAAGNEEKPAGDQGGGDKGPQGKQNAQGQGGNDSGEKASPGSKGSPASSKPGGSGEGEQNDQPGKPTGQPGGKPGGKPEAGEGPDDQNPGEQKPADQTQQADPSAAGKASKSGAAKTDKGQQNKSDAGKSNEDTGEDTREGAKAESGKQGQGDRSQGSTQQKPKGQPSGERQQPNAKGGDEEHDKGASGAGQRSREDKHGSPPAQGNNQQREKTPSGEKSSAQPPNPEAPSPGISNRQSDSKGDQSGDRTGGGKSGGGQKANKPGTGGAGSNTASDEGGGAANEKGDGDTSDKAGEDQEAAGPTGKAGDKSGAGSQSRTKPGEKPQAGGKEDTAGGEGDKQPENRDQPAPNQPGTQGGSNRGVPQGTGAEADEPADPAPPAREVADDANLDFARKATDLALERLKDQLNKGEPDQELLDRLGWTRQDLESFVNRWEEMKRKAGAKGRQAQAARGELDATLRSLGLRPRGTQIKNNLHADQTHAVEGRRSRPPAEYAEQYRVYTQGLSRGRVKDREKTGGGGNRGAAGDERGK